METESSDTPPILNVAWTRYAQLDAAASRRSRAYKQLRFWIAILGVMGTLFAILIASFFSDTKSLVGVVLKIVFVSIPIIASVLAAFGTRVFSDGDWLITRAAAEEYLQEIYFYRTILQKKKSRRTYLERRINEIQRKLFERLGGEPLFKSYDASIPPHFHPKYPDSDPGFQDLTGEEYFKYRVEYQLNWHNRKINQYKTERFRLQLYIIIIGAAGALLAAIDAATIWVALTASLTAALVGWQELRNLDAIIRNYSKVVMELTILNDHWNNLEMEERTDAEFYKMVHGCENILWAQNAEYIKSMQETLERFDLEEEASLVNQVIKESVESETRIKEGIRNHVVDFTGDIFLGAEETVDEGFKSALPSLAEEASSEIVQKELEAIAKHYSKSVVESVVEMAENAIEKTDEQVAFTAYHPKEGKVLVWHLLLVYIHTLSALGDVQKDIIQFRPQIKAPREVTYTSTTRLSRGTEITVIPSCEGITFNPERIAIKWMEDYQRVEFRFSAAESLLDGAANGYINFFVGPLLVGSLKFAMLFNNSDVQSTPDHKVQGEMYRKDAIFVSYSHKDTEIAEAFKVVHKATGHDVLIDIDNLRSGHEWNPELMRMIDRADIFQLFWSKNSSQSIYCQQEWQHALKKKKEGFIRPIYWQHPLPQPPEELSKYHFEFVSLRRKKRSTRK